MATNKRVFTLRLSDEVFDKIGALATREHRSITNYIELGDPAYKAIPVLQSPVHTYRNRQDQGEWKPGWSETGKAKTEAVSQGVQRRKTILL